MHEGGRASTIAPWASSSSRPTAPRAAHAALEAAVTLAVETDDDIEVMTVWRALQGDYGLEHPQAALLDELLAAERQHAEATLAEATGRAREAGIPIRTRLATGEPAEEICAYARAAGARLIAVGSRGYGSVASLLVGSVSNAIIRQAPCPVLVVREPERAREQSRHAHVAAGALTARAEARAAPHRSWVTSRARARRAPRERRSPRGRRRSGRRGRNTRRGGSARPAPGRGTGA